MGDRGFFNPFRKRKDREQADERIPAHKPPPRPPEDAQEEVFALFDDMTDEGDGLYDAFEEAIRAQQVGEDDSDIDAVAGDGGLPAKEVTKPADEASDQATPEPETPGETDADWEETVEALLSSESGDPSKPLDMVALRRAVFAQNLDETDDENVNRRLNWLVDFMNEEEPGSGAQGFINDAEERSLNIRLFLDDPVVTALIRGEEIEMAHVMHAVRRQAREPERPLWRVLLDLSEVDHDLVYGEAAKLYGTPEITINEAYPMPGFLSAIIEVFPERVRERLREHNLLPLELQAVPDSDDHCLLMATHDPSNDATQAFVNGLGLPIALRYAPESVVAHRLSRLMPPPKPPAAEAPPALWNGLMPPDELEDSQVAAPMPPDEADTSEKMEADSFEATFFDEDETFISSSELFVEEAFEDLEADALAEEMLANDAFDEDLDAFEPHLFDDPDRLTNEVFNADDSAEPTGEVDASELPLSRPDAARDLDWSVIEDESFDDLTMTLLDQIEDDAPDRAAFIQEEDFTDQAEPGSQKRISKDSDSESQDEITVTGDDKTIDFADEWTEPRSDVHSFDAMDLEGRVAEPEPDVQTDAETDEPEAAADVSEATVKYATDSELEFEGEPGTEAFSPGAGESSGATPEEDPMSASVGDSADTTLPPEEAVELEESVLVESSKAETSQAEASTSAGGMKEDPPAPRDLGTFAEDTIIPTPIAWNPNPPADDRSEPVAPDSAPADDPVPSAESVPENPADETPAAQSAQEEEPVEAVTEAELKEITSKDRVIAMLVRKGVVTPRDVKRAQIKQKEDRSKDTLWRVLARINGVPREAIFREAARMYAFPEAQVSEGKPDPEFARSVTDTFDEENRDELLKLRVVPYEVDLEQQTGAIKVVFITHDPTRPEVHKMMQKLKLERFELRYAPETVVTMLIAEAFPRRNEYLERLADDRALDLGMAYQSDDADDLVDEDALEAEINRSKLINLFEATLIEAVRQGASDVHIWPNAKRQVEIHFRLDGRLQRWHVEDKVHPEALIAVIKDNSINVDRFERDAAQDGFIQRWIDEALIRFRVSVLPIANAANDVRSESIVIRVLDDRKVVKDLSLLGLDKTALGRFTKAIRQPHGMVILTGPTGSGKTTTLYAALHEVVSPELNVLTVEDPVEYILPGVRQIKLNHKLGLSSALRSILRHDPDVVMVGEMRDRQTAELAIKLANTGHLTFSTLHTNDASSAISRLYKMGIEPFLIAYAINLVVAQRLIRMVCPACKRPEKPQEVDYVLLKNMGFTEEQREQVQRGELVIYQHGSESARERCQTCRGVGYKGRRAVSEALYFSRRIRHMIADASDGGLDEQGVKDVAREEGMLTLLDSAREVVVAGQTSVEEMLRVIASDD